MDGVVDTDGAPMETPDSSEDGPATPEEAAAGGDEMDALPGVDAGEREDGDDVQEDGDDNGGGNGNSGPGGGN